nr:hypothetical protein [Tanacetum cinerariifolium]
MIKNSRTPDSKKPAEAGFLLTQQRSVFAAHDAEDLQQADEQVVDRHVQADGRHDVVALTAVNDRAGLEQNADRREQHEAGADRQLQAADLEEHAGQHCREQHEETCGDEAAEEAHVLAGDQHVGRQAAEHQRRHCADDFSAALHTDVTVENRAEDEPHEASQCESRNQTPRRIAQFVGEEEQTIEADQYDEDVRVTEVHLLRDERHDATEGKGEGQKAGARNPTSEASGNWQSG